MTQFALPEKVGFVKPNKGQVMMECEICCSFTMLIKNHCGPYDTHYYISVGKNREKVCPDCFKKGLWQVDLRTGIYTFLGFPVNPESIEAAEEMQEEQDPIPFASDGQHPS